MNLIVCLPDTIGGAETTLIDYLGYTKEKYIVITNKRMNSSFKGLKSIEKTYMINELSEINKYNFPVKFFKIFQARKRIRKIVEEENINLVYFNNVYEDIVSGFLRLKNVKNIWHIHNNLKKNSIRQRLIKRFLNLPDLIFCPSAYTKKTLSTFIPSKKIQVIHNGINATNIISLPKKEFKYDKVLYVGNIIKRKNQFLLLKVIKYMRKQYNYNPLISFLGRIDDNNYFKQLNDYIKTNQLNAQFKTVTRKEIWNYYNEYDLLFLSSHNESLPTVILEAMSQGMIVFSRDVAGVKEMVQDGKNGYTFDYDETIENIADKFYEITQKENCKISKNAIETIKTNFSNLKKAELIDSYIKRVKLSDNSIYEEEK